MIYVYDPRVGNYAALFELLLLTLQEERKRIRDKQMQKKFSALNTCNLNEKDKQLVAGLVRIVIQEIMKGVIND